jgi:predicted nucleic acid-binding protein
VGRPAVVDANVVIDLKEMDSLFLLNEIFSMVIIPLDTIERELDPEIRECLAGIEYIKGIIRFEAGYNVYSQCLKN